MKKELVMRVRYEAYPCRMVFVTGTPVEIVNHIFENRSPFIETKSIEDFMEDFIRSMRSESGKWIIIRGKNHKERCYSFLKSMIRVGWAKKVSTKNR